MVGADRDHDAWRRSLVTITATGVATLNFGELAQTPVSGSAVTPARGVDPRGADERCLWFLTPEVANAAYAEQAEDVEATILNSEEEEADPEPDPLTASFSGMPGSHDGSTPFDFTLTFSEEPDVGYATLRDDAFDVTNGDVTGASRKTQGSNLSWNIEVEPNGNAAVTVKPPETISCSASGAICTSDDGMLSNSTSATINGPTETTTVVPAMSVAGAKGTEGNQITFTVSLSETTTGQVTVEYTTSSGTATEGGDFTDESGTLTFRPEPRRRP